MVNDFGFHVSQICAPHLTFVNFNIRKVYIYMHHLNVYCVTIRTFKYTVLHTIFLRILVKNGQPEVECVLWKAPLPWKSTPPPPPGNPPSPPILISEQFHNWLSDITIYTPVVNSHEMAAKGMWMDVGQLWQWWWLSALRTCPQCYKIHKKSATTASCQPLVTG